ncbi:MAG: SCO family protein [Rubrivivax sp.]
MSGSKSSGRADAEVTMPEPVGLTVHQLPPLTPEALKRRTLSGRVKMLLVLLACAAPVIASYFTYYVIRPDGRTNYGTLLQPGAPIPPALNLRTVQGAPVAPESLKGQWLLVVVDEGACDADCEKRLFMQRQLREMLGRESDRVDKVWLVTGSTVPRPELIAALAQGVPPTVLRVAEDDLKAWLQPEPGQALRSHLYVVDPMGVWMMRMPADPEPNRVKRDLDRLLRASSSWDRAGR